MVAVQVMANDVAVGMAASQGNFELNVFMLHGFGHRLPVESRARGKGLADQEFMHGGLDKEDAMVHGLALQEHFVTLRPVRNDHAREEN